MKCHKQGTDQAVTVVVSANGQECIEFLPAPAHRAKPNVAEFFVPVSGGEKLTLRIDIEGTMHQGCFDVVADGNHVEQRRINRKQAKFVNEHWGETLYFRRTLTEAEDPKHDLTIPRVVVGTLSPKAISPLIQKDEQADLGVGSIAVVFYSNQRPNDPRTSDPPYARRTEFNKRLDGPTGGIRPTHELKFTTTDDQLRRDKQTQLLKDAKDFRPGKEPIMTIIFYYRSQAAIDRFGGGLAPVGTHEIPATRDQRAALTAINTTAATAPNMQQQDDEDSILRFSEASMRGYGSTTIPADKRVGGPSHSLTAVNEAGAKASAVQQQKGGYMAVGSSTPLQSSALPKPKLMNQPWPGPRLSKSIGISKLDINKNGTATPPVTGAGSTKPSTAMPPPTAIPKMARPGKSARSHFQTNTDRMDSGNAAPPPPATGAGLAQPSSTTAAPSTKPQEPRPEQPAHSHLQTDRDRMSVDNVAPPPPGTAVEVGNPYGLNAPPFGISSKQERRLAMQSLLHANNTSVSNNNAAPPPPATGLGSSTPLPANAPPTGIPATSGGGPSAQSPDDDELYRLSPEYVAQPPASIGVGSPDAFDLEDSPPRIPRRRGRRPSAESLFGIDDDRVSDDDAAPPLPDTAVRSRRTTTTTSAPSHNLRERRPVQYAQSQSDSDADRVGDEDDTPPPSNTAMRSRGAAPTHAPPPKIRRKRAWKSFDDSQIDPDLDREGDVDTAPPPPRSRMRLPPNFRGPRKSAPSVPAKRRRGSREDSPISVSSSSEDDSEDLPVTGMGDGMAYPAPAMEATGHHGGPYYMPGMKIKKSTLRYGGTNTNVMDGRDLRPKD